MKQVLVTFCRREAASKAAPGGEGVGFRMMRHLLQPRRLRKEPYEIRAISGPRIATEQGIQVLLTGEATGPKDGIQVDCSWEHRGRRDTRTRTVREVNLFGTEAADSTLPDQGSVRTILIEYIIEGGSHRRPRQRRKGGQERESHRGWVYNQNRGMACLPQAVYVTVV